MPAKSEAIFTVRDENASAALDRMHTAAQGAEDSLKNIDAALQKLSGSTALDRFATNAVTALKKFDAGIDDSIKKVGELKSAIDDLKDKDIHIEVTGIEKALAEVLALKAELSGLEGRPVSLSSDVRSALPPGFTSAIDSTRAIRLGGLAGTVTSVPSAATSTSTSTGPVQLTSSMSTLSGDIRRLTNTLTGRRDGGPPTPPPRSAPTGAGGGGEGGGLLGPAIHGLPLALAPLIPGLLQAAGGLGGAGIGGMAALGLGMVPAMLTMGAGAVGAGALRLGTQPLMGGVSAAGQYIQQVQQTQLQTQQQQALTAAQNQAQLAGLAAVGLGPGTAQYAQAVAGMEQTAAMTQLQNQLAQQQAKQQFQQQMQMLGVNPQVALMLANQLQGLKTQFGQTFSGGARGAQQQRVAQRLLGFARGPGLQLAGQIYDPFANVAERALGQQGGGGLLGYLGSRQGQAEITQTAQALAAVATPLASIAGNAARLGMTLTRDIAPFTEQLEGSLATKLGTAQEWAASAGGISTINSAFNSARPVWDAMGNLVGAVAKGFDELLTGGGGAAAATLINDMSRGVPGLVSWMDQGTRLLPGLTAELGDLLRALKPIFAGEGLLPQALPILQTFTNLLGSLTKLLGPVGSTALLAGGALAMRGKGGGLGTSLLSAAIPGGGLLTALARKGGTATAATAAEDVGGASLLGGLWSTPGTLTEGLGSLASGALSIGQSLAGPIALGSILAALGQKKGSTGGLLTGVLGGAASGALFGSELGPWGALAGGVIGGGVGALTNLLGGAGANKTVTPPIQFGQAATAQDLAAYLNQTFTTQGTPGHWNFQGGFGRAAWVPGTSGQYAGYGTPMAGYTPQGMTAQQASQERAQAQQAFQQLQQNTASQVVALGQIISQLHTANLSASQRTSLLQQMASTNAGAVTYGRFGAPTGVNQANVRLLMGMTRGGAAGARQLGVTEGTLQAQQNALTAAINKALAAAPAGLKGGLEAALYSGDTTSIEAIANQAPNNAALRTALQNYARVAAGGSFQQVQQQLQAVGTSYQQLTPAQQRTETATAKWQQAFQQDYNTEWSTLQQNGGFTTELPTTPGAIAAWNRFWLSGSPVGAGTPTRPRAVTTTTGAARKSGKRPGARGATTTVAASTDPTKAAAQGMTSSMFDELTGDQTVQHLKNVGPYWAHYLAVGMDSQDTYNAVDAAAGGIVKTVLAQWGDEQATQGAKQAGMTLVDDFAQGLQGAAMGGPGQLANRAMWNLGFNIAWEVAQGAAAGAQGGGGGGGGGAGGAGGGSTANVKGMLGRIFGQGTSLTLERTDMGVDIALKPGQLIHAPGSGKITIYPKWFEGQPFIQLELDAPINGQKYWYIAEQVTPLVSSGTHVKAGQVIAKYAASGTGTESGWGAGGGKTLAQGTSGYTEGQQTAAGKSYAGALGVPVLSTGQTKAITAQHGFHGMVAGPTPILAGEAGPERIDITPAGQAGSGVTVQVVFQAGSVNLSGSQSDFNRFMSNFTSQVERAMHIAVKKTPTSPTRQ
jgi:hypothetical protein